MDSASDNKLDVAAQALRSARLAAQPTSPETGRLASTMRPYCLVYAPAIVEAETLSAACTEAIESDDWGEARIDYESARETHVVFAVRGAHANAYNAPSCDALVFRLRSRRYLGITVRIRPPSKRPQWNVDEWSGCSAVGSLRDRNERTRNARAHR